MCANLISQVRRQHTNAEQIRKRLNSDGNWENIKVISPEIPEHEILSTE